jgi:hypothetical protein
MPLLETDVGSQPLAWESAGPDKIMPRIKDLRTLAR